MFELTDDRELWLTRLLQAVLLGLVALGVLRGSSAIAVNAAGSLVVSLLPALARREADVRMDPVLVLWLTAATLLHAVGILGPYRNRFWWDYLTHALSASIIVGIAYAVVHGIDRHARDVRLPEPFLSAFLFLFVVALGVLWELLEFGATQASHAMGRQSVLIIFGLPDTMTDLLFTTAGGVLVVLWGRDYFQPLSAKVAAALSR